MKMKFLSIVIATVSVGAMSVPAHAVYNLYKRDGLSLDVNGEVNVQFSNNREKFTAQSNAWAVDGMGWKHLLTGAYEERKDRRTRLGQDMGASWLDFLGSQLLPNDWRVTGTVGFGYFDSGTGIFLNNANLAFDKKNIGSISLGRQYLHTGYVTRTGTYTPLETFGESSVRLDYTGTPNLHVSAFYGLPATSDVRYPNNFAEVESFGASLSYKLPLAENQSLRFATGYTDTNLNPNTALNSRDGNIYPVDTKGAALSAEYRYSDFLVAADYGQQKAKLNGSTTAKADVDYLGVKLGYEFTPRFSMTAGYGTKETKRTNQAGVKSLLNSAPDCVDQACTNLINAYEPFLFDKVEEKRGYVRADYYLRENVRLYGRVDALESQMKQAGQDVAKLENTEYRAGISFSF